MLETTQEEQNFGFGAFKDKSDRNDFRLCGVTQDTELPKVFELPKRFSPNNQFSRPSCTSQAQVHHKEEQENAELSARFVMALTKDFEKNTKYGAYTRNCFKIVNKYGACQESLYAEPPSTMSWEEYIDKKYIPKNCYDDGLKHKSHSYWRVENTIEDIKQSLFQHKESVVISVMWYKEFNNAGLIDGVLPTVFKNKAGGHAIEVFRFDDNKKQLKIQNSWGKSWGKDGYFYMPYSVFPRVILDAWISRDLPQKFPVDFRYGEKRTWNKYLMEKKIAFNPWLFKKIGRLPSNREISAMVFGYWGYSEVFTGTVGDNWLNYTKPEYNRINNI